MLVQHPRLLSFHPMYLPRHEQITFEPRGIPGFARARGRYYTGQTVFVPGTWLYSHVFDTWNLFKWLTPLAILWASCRRDWFFGSGAVLIGVATLTIAVAAQPEPRYCAIVAPLYSLLIGGMVAALIESFQGLKRSGGVSRVRG